MPLLQLGESPFAAAGTDRGSSDLTVEYDIYASHPTSHRTKLTSVVQHRRSTRPWRRLDRSLD